jgi:rfaE bifunctional protein kinase chain/domain
MAPSAATAAARVLIVDDSMLDCYWEGSVERISPEAPVPVLRMGRKWQRPGGAANVALNVATLDALPTLVTLLGDDETGHALAQALQRQVVYVHAWYAPGWPTTQKIRAVCRRQQQLRVDIEQAAAPDAAPTLVELASGLLASHRWLLLATAARPSSVPNGRSWYRTRIRRASRRRTSSSATPGAA